MCYESALCWAIKIIFRNLEYLPTELRRIHIPNRRAIVVKFKAYKLFFLSWNLCIKVSPHYSGFTDEIWNYAKHNGWVRLPSPISVKSPTLLVIDALKLLFLLFAKKNFLTQSLRCLNAHAIMLHYFQSTDRRIHPRQAHLLTHWLW